MNSCRICKAMGTLNHSERKHAILSASSSARWLACPPSARLADKFAESNRTSVYAEEGTLFHEICNLVLDKWRGAVDEKTAKKEMTKLKKDKLYKEEMDGYAEDYLTYIRELFSEAQQRTPDPVLLVEERLDYSQYAPEGEGTGDACIIGDTVMDIIDVKYGKGIPVSATDNSQLKLYALGALAKYDLMYDIHTVKMHIFQPRTVPQNINCWEVSVEDLQRWGEEYVKPRALLAFRGEGDKEPGTHCRFCPVKAFCAALAQKNIELAKDDFREPGLLSDKRLLEIYNQLPMLVDWANSVGDYILNQAVNDGKQWPGLKLVEGISRKIWLDETKVREVLHAKGITDEQIEKREILGVTALAKVVGKEVFAEIEQYAGKTDGKLTLVPESDKRPAVNTAAAAAAAFAQEDAPAD